MGVILMIYTNFSKAPSKASSAATILPGPLDRVPEMGLMALAQAYCFIELFAGVGNMSRMMRYANVACASCDLDYGSGFKQKDMNPMDMCTSPGFAWLC